MVQAVPEAPVHTIQIKGMFCRLQKTDHSHQHKSVHEPLKEFSSFKENNKCVRHLQNVLNV